jgi:hypothetical protein
LSAGDGEMHRVNQLTVDKQVVDKRLKTRHKNLWSFMPLACFRNLNV